MRPDPVYLPHGEQYWLTAPRPRLSTRLRTAMQVGMYGCGVVGIVACGFGAGVWW